MDNKSNQKIVSEYVSVDWANFVKKPDEDNSYIDEYDNIIKNIAKPIIDFMFEKNSKYCITKKNIFIQKASEWKIEWTDKNNIISIFANDEICPYMVLSFPNQIISASLLTLFGGATTNQKISVREILTTSEKLLLEKIVTLVVSIAQIRIEATSVKSKIYHGGEFKNFEIDGISDLYNYEISVDAYEQFGPVAVAFAKAKISGGPIKPIGSLSSQYGENARLVGTLANAPVKLVALLRLTDISLDRLGEISPGDTIEAFSDGLSCARLVLNGRTFASGHVGRVGNAYAIQTSDLTLNTEMSQGPALASESQRDLK